MKRKPATFDGEPLVGYLNVLKPPAMTSFDVVARIRSLSGERRVGHAGTLDPAAIGVLPVALGHATRTLSSPLWRRKVYWADVRFGVATDTDDAEGRPLSEAPADVVTAEAVLAALPAFAGDIQQRPPAFSAIQIGGERAYARARSGQVADLPDRVVRVDAIELTSWRPPVASLRIQCRSGTYVRSIARDLGAAVGCPAHLASLVRLRVGPFAIEDAIDLRILEAIADHGSWERVLYPGDLVDPGTPVIIGSEGRIHDYANGREWEAPNASHLPTGTVARLYSAHGRFRGYVRRTHLGRWQRMRGLALSQSDSR